MRVAQPLRQRAVTVNKKARWESTLPPIPRWLARVLSSGPGRLNRQPDQPEANVTHIAGIHHVTSVGADPDRTLKFYMGTLGLQLVRKTVNFDEPSVLHFYFGAFRGSPGTLLTFFIHEGAARGRRGTGQVSSVALAVPPGSLQEWRKYLAQQRVEIVGRAWAFGEEYLCFTDPDGLALALGED